MDDQTVAYIAGVAMALVVVASMAAAYTIYNQAVHDIPEGLYSVVSAAREGGVPPPDRGAATPTEAPGATEAPAGTETGVSGPVGTPPEPTATTEAPEGGEEAGGQPLDVSIIRSLGTAYREREFHTAILDVETTSIEGFCVDCALLVRASIPGIGEAYLLAIGKYMVYYEVHESRSTTMTEAPGLASLLRPGTTAYLHLLDIGLFIDGKPLYIILEVEIEAGEEEVEAVLVDISNLVSTLNKPAGHQARPPHP